MRAKVLFCVVTLLALNSCTQTRYLPVETVHDRWHTSFITDTVTIKDSVVIDRAGDTIRETRWHDRWRTSIVRDTVASTDTIRVPYPMEVPAKLTAWEHVKVSIGGWAIIVVVIYILILTSRRKWI